MQNPMNIFEKEGSKKKKNTMRNVVDAVQILDAVAVVHELLVCANDLERIVAEEQGACFGDVLVVQ